MIRTFGLTYITLGVNEVKRPSNFYQKVFGVKGMYCNNDPDVYEVEVWFDNIPSSLKSF